MATVTKRQKMIAEKVDPDKIYRFEDAVNLLDRIVDSQIHRIR